MTVGDLKAWLQAHWPAVKAALLAGSYLPREVRAVDIPKPSGGVRTLGVPTVVDRLIQQAVLQVLQPIFEDGFRSRVKIKYPIIICVSARACSSSRRGTRCA